MSQFKNKHVFITGGSSGIGKTVGRYLALEGANISIVARSQPRLEYARLEIESYRQSPKQQFRAYAADVSIQTQIEGAISRAITESGPIDILITSAAIAVPGYFQALSDQIFRDSMEINYFGTLHAVRAVVPQMIERKSGQIMMLSSGAGLIGIFGYSAYGPTKFALKGLAESLRSELKPHNIHVSVVYPPDTHTPQLVSENRIKPRETKAIGSSGGVLEVDQVAQAMIKGLKRKRFEVAPGLEMFSLSKVGGWVKQILNWQFDRTIKKIQQLDQPETVDAAFTFTRPVPDRKAATSFGSMVELLRDRAGQLGDHIAFTFLDADGSTLNQLSYSQLDSRAKAIAHVLKENGAAKKPVLISFRPGLEFIEAFFGCLYAGAIAVPCHFPSSRRYSTRFKNVSRSCGALICLTSQNDKKKICDLLEDNVEQVIGIQSIDDQLAHEWRFSQIDPKQTALLQYTSGSTGAPKGVMITHQNLLENLQVIRETFEIWEGGRSLFWLPITHDMGLVGGILTPILIGWESFLMAPHTFAENPSTWLRTLSKHKIKITGAPNFALDYVAENQKLNQESNIDLSHLEILFCGSEPVRLSTLQNFKNIFTPADFKPEATLPCYGMAETTLLVSSISKSALPHTTNRGGKTYMSCGKPHPSYHVKIVDSNILEALPEEQIGEIWLYGPSVAVGYWENTEATKAVFEQKLPADPNSTYFRSGDLGYMYDGELYITGRLKDVIIHNGENFFPDDIEQLVEGAHVGIQPNGTAVISVDDGH
ncbi:MAG: SDR family NAD(P)-dependent oxidoreductase, partial [Chloroflexota bacterium]